MCQLVLQFGRFGDQPLGKGKSSPLQLKDWGDNVTAGFLFFPLYLRLVSKGVGTLEKKASSEVHLLVGLIAPIDFILPG